jgi:hypothetical protein
MLGGAKVSSGIVLEVVCFIDVWRELRYFLI